MGDLSTNQRSQSSPENAVFLSCSNHDLRSVSQIRDALKARGFCVWMGTGEPQPGDGAEECVHRRVLNCGLFIPIISRSTSWQATGFFRQQWSWAIERLLGAPESRRNFVLPVVIDDLKIGETDLPEEFKNLRTVLLPGAQVTPEFWQAVETIFVARPEAAFLTPSEPVIHPAERSIHSAEPAVHPLEPMIRNRGRFRDLPLSVRDPDRREPSGSISSTSVSEGVTFSAFAPPTVCIGRAFILDVWAHTVEQIDHVRREAETLGRDRKLGVKSGVPVVRGTVIGFALEIPTLQVSDPVECLVWNGSPANASYVVNVPVDARLGAHEARVIVTASGIPVTKLSFLIQVGPFVSARPEQVELAARPTRTAFASYSSRDRAEVLARVQGMTKALPDLDVFLDVLSLRSGQNWEAELRRCIPARDVFYLFWSQHAKASAEVEKEWRMALEIRGIQYIDPVPLCDPTDTPPPPELRSLHFNDLYLSYIKASAGKKPTSPVKKWWKVW